MNSQARYLIVAILLVSPTDALAFCSEPSFYESEPSFSAQAPNAPSSFNKPSVPYCMSEYSYTGRHTCDDWEVDSYFDDVNSYIDDLNDYISEAAGFAREVEAFANEAIEFARGAQIYADEAYSYAECEADEAKTQHE